MDFPFVSACGRDIQAVEVSLRQDSYSFGNQLWKTMRFSSIRGQHGKCPSSAAYSTVRGKVEVLKSLSPPIPPFKIKTTRVRRKEERKLQMQTCLISTVKFKLLCRPCLVYPKNQKVFKIPRHIESFDTCIKH